MASQISHVVYAHEYLKKYPQPQSKEDFLTGVLFPDIRRVSNLTRAQTHQHFSDLDLRFKGMDSFEAGWKFHVWCDLRRNELLRDYGFLDVPAVKDVYFLAYYFLEDELLWDTYKNWETVQSILLNAPFQPLFLQLPKGDWQFWYGLQAQYIGQKPTPASIRRFCKQQPAVALKVDRIIDGMEKLRKNRKVVEMLRWLAKEMV